MRLSRLRVVVRRETNERETIERAEYTLRARLRGHAMQGDMASESRLARVFRSLVCLLLKLGTTCSLDHGDQDIVSQNFAYSHLMIKSPSIVLSFFFFLSKTRKIHFKV